MPKKVRRQFLLYVKEDENKAIEGFIMSWNI